MSNRARFAGSWLYRLVCVLEPRHVSNSAYDQAFGTAQLADQ